MWELVKRSPTDSPLSTFPGRHGDSLTISHGDLRLRCAIAPSPRDPLLGWNFADARSAVSVPAKERQMPEVRLLT